MNNSFAEKFIQILIDNKDITMTFGYNSFTHGIEIELYNADIDSSQMIIITDTDLNNSKDELMCYAIDELMRGKYEEKY